MFFDVFQPIALVWVKEIHNHRLILMLSSEDAMSPGEVQHEKASAAHEIFQKTLNFPVVKLIKINHCPERARLRRRGRPKRKFCSYQCTW